MWRATIEANELGLWRATDGKLTALANVGPANPREFTEVTSTTEVLAPLPTRPAATRCGSRTASGVQLPRVVAVRSSDTYQAATTGSGCKMREPAWCAASACCRCSPA